MKTTSLYPPHINSLIEAALAGDTDAQIDLGDCFREGDGVQHDLKGAVRWYRMAAEQGDPYGQNNLGSMYFNGLGIPYDAEEAVKWYRLAALQGVPVAQFNLGVCYRDGEGVPLDWAEAARYFKLAADAGHPDAQNEYRVCGRYTATDQSQKPKLFLIQGNPDDAEEELAADIVLYETLTGRKATPEEIQEYRGVFKNDRQPSFPGTPLDPARQKPGAASNSDPDCGLVITSKPPKMRSTMKQKVNNRTPLEEREAASPASDSARAALEDIADNIAYIRHELPSLAMSNHDRAAILSVCERFDSSVKCLIPGESAGVLSPVVDALAGQEGRFALYVFGKNADGLLDAINAMHEVVNDLTDLPFMLVSESAVNILQAYDRFMTSTDEPASPGTPQAEHSTGNAGEARPAGKTVSPD